MTHTKWRVGNQLNVFRVSCGVDSGVTARRSSSHIFVSFAVLHTWDLGPELSPTVTCRGLFALQSQLISHGGLNLRLVTHFNSSVLKSFQPSWRLQPRSCSNPLETFCSVKHWDVLCQLACTGCMDGALVNPQSAQRPLTVLVRVCLSGELEMLEKS